MLKRFAVPAALALATLALAVPATASAAEPAVIYPVAQDLHFYGSNDGVFPVDYSCSELTSKLEAQLVQPSTSAVFTGNGEITCDGVRRTSYVYVNGPEYVSKSPGRVTLTLEGTTLEQNVNVLPATSDGPVFPLVKASVTVIGKIVFTSATQGTISVKYACNGYAGSISVVITGKHGERATGGDGISCNAQGYPNGVDTTTFRVSAEGKGFRQGTQKVTVQATLANEEPLAPSKATLVRKHKR